MTRPIEIALAADLDLNVIDGSAIWLQSLALTLARGNRVTVVCKAPVTRDLLSGPLAEVRLDVPARPRSPAQLLDALVRLDAELRFDVVILRGVGLCHRAVGRFTGRQWSYLTDFPQRVTELTPAVRARLSSIAAASRHLLCQTEPLRAYLEAYIPGVVGKALLLPPMIPDAVRAAPSSPDCPERARPEGPRESKGSVLRLGYAGKLAPRWNTLEMVELLASSETELHVIGDKLFGPPAWIARMERALARPGVTWHRGQSRADTLALLGKVDVGLAHRSADLDDSLELSTKLLEYGALGLPTVLNRTPMHEALLGADYPLFASSDAELRAAISLARDPAVRATAAARGHAASRAFTFDAVAAGLQPWLDRAAAGQPAIEDVDRPKLAGSQFRVGLLDPAGLDRALTVLEHLRATEPRYRLHVRGPLPARALFARIHTTPLLGDAVGFDAPGPDVPSWLRKIGVLLDAADDRPPATIAATIAG